MTQYKAWVEEIQKFSEGSLAVLAERDALNDQVAQTAAEREALVTEIATLSQELEAEKVAFY